MQQPSYFTVVHDKDSLMYHINEAVDDTQATYYVNKIIANGTELQDIQVICGYKIDLQLGGAGC